MSQLLEDLEAIVDVLDEKGWCQSSPLNPNSDGRVCLESASAHVTMGDMHRWNERPGMPYWGNWSPEGLERHGAVICALAAQVDEFAPGFYEALGLMGASYAKIADPTCALVWAWNDRPSTSVEDVKLVLKRAIEAEEAKA